MRDQSRRNHLIFLSNIAFLTSHHNLTVITSFQAMFSGRTACLLQGDESGRLPTCNCWVPTASGKTLNAIQRRRRRPYCGVKQMAARLKEGGMDVTFMTTGGKARSQKRTGKNRETDQGCARDEPQGSNALVHGRDRQDCVSGDHAKVHEDVCQTLEKDESAVPCGCTQDQTPEVAQEDEAQDLGGAHRNSCPLLGDHASSLPCSVRNRDCTFWWTMMSIRFPSRSRVAATIPMPPSWSRSLSTALVKESCRAHVLVHYDTPSRVVLGVTRGAAVGLNVLRSKTPLSLTGSTAVAHEEGWWSSENETAATQVHCLVLYHSCTCRACWSTTGNTRRRSPVSYH